MADTTQTKSAQIRARLNYPVIDSDGHNIETDPVIADYVRKVGGSEMPARVRAAFARVSPYLNPAEKWHKASPQERRAERIIRPGFWGYPSKARELATAMLPKLLYERLPETGIDFSVVYGSAIVQLGNWDDDEVRQVWCRALNTATMDLTREYADRLTPVAAIPAHTPAEAIRELEFAVKELGFKVFTMPSYIKRPLPRARQAYPDACYLDVFVDSPYDYDPFWAKCLELKVAPTFHSTTQGLGFRTSISSINYNHIGHFATSCEAICKALFLGGVTRRFADLRFAFLEGGAGWAASLLCDIMGHWKKRNLKALDRVNPIHLDRAEFFQLCRDYGGEPFGRVFDRGEEALLVPPLLRNSRETAATIDDFRPIAMESVEEMRELFVKPFFFGCEADDPMNGVAFDRRRNFLGARLYAILGSDIGHWDVPDPTEVLEEAYELVEKDMITEEDLRDFVFVNPVKLWTALNPDFFKGTAVEGELAKL